MIETQPKPTSYESIPNFEQEKSDLAAIGLRPFTGQEIREAHQELARAFAIGLERTGEPTMADGGILGVKTGVPPLTPDRYQAIPDNAVLSGSYGGTSWYTGIVEKQGGETNVTIINNGATPHVREDSHRTFVERMGNHLLGGVGDRDISHIQAVGISCGFEQKNSMHSRGIDAQLPAQPSNWRITDLDLTVPPCDQPFLGENLLRYIHAQGAPQISEVYFQNDTNAVVHDVHEDASVLPVGFVFGTGSNAAIGEVNTQASSLPLFPKDQTYEAMVREGIVPDKLQMKLWMGGERIAYRVAGAMHALAHGEKIRPEAADAVLGMIQRNGKGLIVSKLTSGELGYDDLIQDGVILSPAEFRYLQRAAETSLLQAGQAIGVLMATTIEATGHTSGAARVPVEGSVFWNAHDVRPVALNTVSFLLPDVQLTPYEASGLRGVGKLAMTQSYEKAQGETVVFS